MDALGAHMAQVHVVRLVLGWHEPDGDSVHKLHPAQRRHTHVEEDAVQHRHGDELEAACIRHFGTSLETG